MTGTTPTSQTQSIAHQATRGIPTLLPPKFQYLLQYGHQMTRASWVKPNSTTPQWFVADFVAGTVTCFDLNGNVLGQITGLVNPQGLTIHLGYLYVAETGSNRIDVFRVANSCNSTIVKKYNDSGQYPVDVAVGNGWVYASNIFSTSGAPGSITWWTGNNSTPAGNYNAGSTESGNYFIALDQSGNLYSSWSDVSGFGQVQCYAAPAGSGPGTNQGISLTFPGGMAVANNGDVVVSDQLASVNTYSGGSCGGGGWTLASSISNGGDDWVDIALRPGNGLIGASDASAVNAKILTYPAGALQATFTAPGAAQPIGIATTGNYHN